MHKVEIGNRSDGQHIVTARNSLNKGVLIVKRHDIARAQVLHGAFC